MRSINLIIIGVGGALLLAGASSTGRADYSRYFFDLAPATWPGETRFGIRTAPEHLTPGKPKVDFKEVASETYEVDSEAVVEVPAENIFKVSLDYDSYKQFAPFVLDNRTVESSDNNDSWPATDYYVWTKMRYTGSYMLIKKTMTSMYYLHAQPLMGAVKPNDFATRWVLEKKHEGWKFPTESYFSVLDGSWYILPLDEHRTYVRYFIKMKTDTWIPNRVVKSVLKDSLKPSVAKLVLAIANRANLLENNERNTTPSGGTHNRSP